MPRNATWQWGPPGDWVQHAACSPHTADLFHPPMTLRRTIDGWKYWRAVDAAKTICRSCPVIEACREHGRNEMFGIWGGLAPEERGFNGCDDGPWRNRQRQAVLS